MRTQLDDRFFPFVIRPGRYAGGEIGQIVKDRAGRFAYLHCYPDKYELGQSYPGLQMLYHIINRDDRFLCERAFAPDTDAEACLRKEQLPFFSLESRRPAGEFDAVGFTLVDETVYTNVLTMLDLAGIPIRSAERGESAPIIMAGGPAAYNPEPMAPFIDLFFIGDAEEGLPELLGLLHEHRGKSRRDRLRLAAQQIESVYVPAFYDDQLRPTDPDIPGTIKARVIRDLQPDFYPPQPLVPLVETVHSFLPVEIMRGCPQGCRFCLAGAIYRPVRLRPEADIIHQAETQINTTGYEDVSLMSLSTTDYPQLESLAATLARRLEPLKVSLTLPSLRPGSVSPTVLDAVRRVRKANLTIAPEAGTERLRLFIRKDFPDAAIYDTVRLAYERGWTTIKLYFMIGLPTETDDDLLGIANICREVALLGRGSTVRRSINVTLSVFVPKAHTPFQWDEMIAPEEIHRRITLIKKRTRVSEVSFKINQPDINYLQGLLGRGGRELAPVIETAFRSGCRFEGWQEHLSMPKWRAACDAHGIDMAASQQAIPFSRPLPWRHIVKGPTVEHLMAERQRSSGQLRDFVPHVSSPASETGTETSGEFGRGKKKVASRVLSAPTKNRVRIRWGKSERYRFMSHLDNIRFIERAIRRSRIPVAFSQGFNPGMKLSFGPPLPVGFTSEAEYVDITLEVSLAASMLDTLSRAFPDGTRIHESGVVLGSSDSLTAALNRVVYTVPIAYWDDPAKLERNLAGVMKQSSLTVQRVSPSETKQIDLRPAIYSLRVSDGYLYLELGIGSGGYARPGEVITFLADGLTVAPVALPWHRREVYRITPDGSRINPMDL